MEGYWFRSTQFRIIEDEDLDTAPGIYGRQLAYWLRDGLVEAGYARADVQPEPWGWCVVVSLRPLLWVGCGGVVPDGVDAEAVRGDALLWHCHAEVEHSWLMGWCRGAAVEASVRQLDIALQTLLVGERRIQLVDPPL
jgi:hypothetical protein